jgi:hypothetical protein
MIKNGDRHKRSLSGAFNRNRPGGRVLHESHTAVFSQQLTVLSEINSPANLERRAVQAAATEAHIEALTSRVADLLRQHNGTHKPVKKQ